VIPEGYPFESGVPHIFENFDNIHNDSLSIAQSFFYCVVLQLHVYLGLCTN
jgi:hypothetical protein